MRRGVATFRELLKNPESPTVGIRRQLRLVSGNYVEMKALDESIWEEIDDDEFNADLPVSCKFDAEVVEIPRTLTSADTPRQFTA